MKTSPAAASPAAEKEQPLRQPTPKATRKGGSPRPVKPFAKPRSLWSSLFLVHPWLLVGALWITFIAMIAIALVGLSNPGRELALDPIHSVNEPPLSAPDVAAASRLSTLDADGDFTHRDPAAITPQAVAEKDMPAWPLLLMVLACAGGCMLMSQQGITLSSESRRSKRRAAPQPSVPRPVRSVAVGGGRKRRKQRRVAPHRPASQVMAFRTGHKLRHTTPGPKPAPSKPVSFAVKGDSSAKPVSVVPADESSPLDWKEGSLAHKLDVRQQRSINSFL
ncbi:hypothetical protein [Leptothoe kymatousa]|uniref:Transmembrane protein n=1 Tax=Leptothoe kymatousa TAU-MAC 1615 TaxID=2364775 RepID=A0ABS5XZX4_9CYAN|nr:hypothetical protein [Leptothoe kymatousa]MBT9310921.1 hypothetical protein [Leptothoe kymatousa TAU-MAC 1615]